MKEAAAFFKALADEARLQILWLLFNRRELCVCELMEVLGTTQSKTSRHLRTLLNAGMVTDRREGLWSYYAFRAPAEPLARAQLETLRKSLAAAPAAHALLERLASTTPAAKVRAACR